MAEHALLEGGVGQVMERPAGSRDSVAAPSEAREVDMALQADQEPCRAVQQACVGTSVRIVATRATLDAHRGVLVQERPALVGVALQARKVVPEGLRDHARRVRRAPGRDGSAVRIVAVGAGHRALVHPMLERHLEPRPDLLVAAVAEVALPVSQQRAGIVRRMHGMAARAADLARQMRGPLHVQLAEIAGVAA